jgi:hypothetical protein
MLSLVRVVRDAYGATLWRIGDFLNQSLIWALASYVGSMLLAIGTVGGPPSVAQFGALVAALIQMVFLATFMVAWHRWVLLGERTQLQSVFAIDRRVLWFLAVLVAAFVGAAAPMLIALMLLSDSGAAMNEHDLVTAASWLTLALGALALVGIYLVGRLALSFPMMAVANPIGALRRSWQMTQSCHLSIALVVLTPLPLWLIQHYVLPLLARMVVFPGQLVLLWVMTGFIENWFGFLVAAVGVSALSSAWRQLTAPPGGQLDITA